jgi:hypothetical protein
MRGNLRGIDGFESLSFRSIDEFVVDEQSCSIQLACFLGFWEITVVDKIFRLEVESTEN